jgi:hypothetical protein
VRIDDDALNRAQKTLYGCRGGGGPCAMSKRGDWLVGFELRWSTLTTTLQRRGRDQIRSIFHINIHTWSVQPRYVAIPLNLREAV